MAEQGLITTTLETEMPVEKLRAFVKQNVRGEVVLDLVAHDPLRVPKLYVVELSFSTIEERDKFIIAWRLLKPAPSSVVKPRIPA